MKLRGSTWCSLAVDLPRVSLGFLQILKVKYVCIIFRLDHVLSSPLADVLSGRPLMGCFEKRLVEISEKGSEQACNLLLSWPTGYPPGIWAFLIRPLFYGGGKCVLGGFQTRLATIHSGGQTIQNDDCYNPVAAKIKTEKRFGHFIHYFPIV